MIQKISILFNVLCLFILVTLFSSKYFKNDSITPVDIATSEDLFNVQYSSKHADYAEWLRCIDHNEDIERGDIVAVIGGQITKNLKNAEQIMVVSEQPSLLGNRPSKNLYRKGNAVTFIGQTTVNVLGEVTTGDYIVAKNDNSGYGIAINPDNMSIENYRFSVGRAWESNPSPQLKKVNTVIGIHNGEFLNLLNEYESRIKKIEKRLKALERK